MNWIKPLCLGMAAFLGLAVIAPAQAHGQRWHHGGAAWRHGSGWHGGPRWHVGPRWHGFHGHRARAIFAPAPVYAYGYYPYYGNNVVIVKKHHRSYPRCVYYR